MNTNISPVEQIEEQSTDSTISLLDFLENSEGEVETERLEVLRLGVEPVFVSLFTETVVDEHIHFLEGTDTWQHGYVRCLGDGCPACRAGLERKRYLLLPVVDRVDGRVKVLRIPVMKGPGKLLTEIGKVLKAPDREKMIVKIIRSRDFTHTVSIQSHAEIDPEVAAVAQRFADGVSSGAIDIRSVTATVTADEMAEHERVARHLKLQGQGS